MRIYQAFGKIIDLEAVAVISGGVPSEKALKRNLERGGMMAGYLQVGSLVIQLVEKPVELWTTVKDAEGEAERIQAEWDGLVEAWKAVKS